MRTGVYDEQQLEEHLNKRGFMNRFLNGLTKSVRKAWHIYPIGVLFGLGFDTATEVGLLVLAGGAAAFNLPFYAILVLPILFAAGMCLMDTIDGVFMNARLRLGLRQAGAQGLLQHHDHRDLGRGGAGHRHDRAARRAGRAGRHHLRADRRRRRHPARLRRLRDRRAVRRVLGAWRCWSGGSGASRSAGRPTSPHRRRPRRSDAAASSGRGPARCRRRSRCPRRRPAPRTRGRAASLTSTPPAASAACDAALAPRRARRSMSKWMRLRCGRGASICWNQSVGSWPAGSTSPSRGRRHRARRRSPAPPSRTAGSRGMSIASMAISSICDRAVGPARRRDLAAQAAHRGGDLAGQLRVAGGDARLPRVCSTSSTRSARTSTRRCPSASAPQVAAAAAATCRPCCTEPTGTDAASRPARTRHPDCLDGGGGHGTASAARRSWRRHSGRRPPTTVAAFHRAGVSRRVVTLTDHDCIADAPRARGRFRPGSRRPGSRRPAPTGAWSAYWAGPVAQPPVSAAVPAILVPGFISGDVSLALLGAAPAPPGTPHLPQRDRREPRLHRRDGGAADPARWSRSWPTRAGRSRWSGTAAAA